MNSMKVFLLLAVLVGVSAAIKCKVGVGDAAVDMECPSNYEKCLTVKSVVYSCGSSCGLIPYCSECNHDLCNSATGLGTNHLLILGFLQSVIFLLAQ